MASLLSSLKLPIHTPLSPLPDFLFIIYLTITNSGAGRGSFSFFLSFFNFSYCQLQIGICQETEQQGHFAIYLCGDCAAALRTFSTPWGSSGWSEAICAPGNPCNRSLDSQIISGADFMIPIPISSYLKSTKSLHDDISSSWLAEIL